MSRLIIKNLPKRISSERLKTIFSEKGEVTDIQLKFKSDGSFRQFAFVGFKREEQAQAAKDYFHHTYIDSSKVKIEVCENLGSENVKSLNKHSKNQPEEEANIIDNEKSKKKKKKKKSDEDKTPDELKSDPKFQEFLSLHKQKSTWGDSTLPRNRPEITPDEAYESEEQEKEEEAGDERKTSGNKGEDRSEKNDPQVKPSTNEKASTTSKNTTKPRKKKKAVILDDRWTVKVKDLPRYCNKSQIKKFFAPIKIKNLSFASKFRDMIYLRFSSEKDMKQALNKHRGFLEGNRITVTKSAIQKPEASLKTHEVATEDCDVDPLIETGRIFVRNLCYTATEEEIESHFKSFGTVTEVHLPFDSYTKKPKGFAFVTFMFPEHAVKALSELDGSSFQGRTLHLIPAKARKMIENEENEDTSFKKKKESKLKASSGSWHNWNTLFLGANAVADVMAQKYNTSKSKLLDADSRGSVAVTMALGETQIVSETKDFLINQGVDLDAFQNPQTERSKTIILVKNLPANTKSYQIRELFSVHGEITRLVLPPSGVTAIVEFQHPTEAKLAFRKLAYSKFQHVPLYLEWAPVNALNKNKPVTDQPSQEKENRDIEENNDVADESNEKTEDQKENEEAELGTVLFVKNLNFETREEALKQHFKSCGKVLSATVAKKPDPKNPGHQLSMGYGFVQFKKKKSATKALKELQKSTLDDHCLELKLSNRDTLVPEEQRKLSKPGEQKGTKILIRNLPFEATTKEIKEIFSVFGELKALRLPRKVTGEHRGFGFVDFLTRQDAKRAMTSLGASTHVFGRRLVLEWAKTDDPDDVEALRKKTAEHFDHQQYGTARKKLKDSLPQDPADLSS